MPANDKRDVTDLFWHGTLRFRPMSPKDFGEIAVAMNLGSRMTVTIGDVQFECRSGNMKALDDKPLDFELVRMKL